MIFLKRAFFIFLVSVSVLITFRYSASAQTRIRFKRGASSTTISGAINKNSSKCFTLGAKEGQEINAKLRSQSGKAHFQFVFGAGPDKGGTSYNTTAMNGDNQFCIENFGKPTIFTLNISVR